MRFEPLPLPHQLHLVPLIDQPIEQYGHTPLSPYVEHFWLPHLGPTATLLYRRLGMWVIQEPDGLTVDSADLAAGFGLGQSLDAGSKFARAVGRLTMFDAAQWQDDSLAVRRALPSVQPHRRMNLNSA